jgi:hypothetical protein
VVFDSLCRTGTENCKGSGNEERRDELNTLNKVLSQVLVLILLVDDSRFHRGAAGLSQSISRKSLFLFWKLSLALELV